MHAGATLALGRAGAQITTPCAVARLNHPAMRRRYGRTAPLATSKAA